MGGGRTRQAASHLLEDFSSAYSASNSQGRTGRTEISADGRRATTKAKKTSTQVQPSQTLPAKPNTPEDQFSSWTPCGEVEEDPSPPPQSTPLDKNSVEDDGSATGNKRKRYQNTDDPMASWVPLMDQFMNELLRQDGLGDHFHSAACTSCDQKYAKEDNCIFRCYDCYEELECLTCCLKRHKSVPLHRVKEWNGDFWEDITLRDMGLVYSVGHFKSSCPGPGPVRDMIVIHTNGIHRVRFQYCSCRAVNAASNIQQLLRIGWYPATTTDPHTCATFRALDFFRILNVVGSVNGDAYYRSLVKLTDPCLLRDLPDRYKAFVRMERQYSFLIRVKRSGRPYQLIYPGDVAVLCWACPHDGINLPAGWKDAAPQWKFLYMLIIALDANFRLKNRIRGNEHGHPSLGPGSAYFVEPSSYREHIKKHVVEEDITTCVAFAALLEKETKVTTGMRTSGVGGVVCARHELVRPLGLGDLQKGERYSNMDFILMSAIQSLTLQYITVSYDIICQYKTNLPKRIPHLPPALHPSQDLHLQFGIPTWHAAVHELSCRSQNALTYQPGVGRTDGEGIERTWALLNDAAWATKEMGEGSRHDHLDDRIDHHNHTKNIGMGEMLARRLIIASDELHRQVNNFQTNSSTLKPEMRAKWQEMIDTWERTKTGKNPYMLSGEHKNPSEAQVRAALKKEEAKEAAAGKVPIHSTTAAAFLAIGMTIETLQQKVVTASKSSFLSLGGTDKIYERRVAILAKLKGFRDLQRLYAPGAIRAITKEDEARSPDVAPPSAELIKLWLPSDIPKADRPSSLAPGLAAAEARLREAQCYDSLTTIRRHLHSKQHLVAWRDANAVGQDIATRSRTLIDEVGDKVKAAANRYRLARHALISLRSEEQCTKFPPLVDEDLTSDIVVEDDALAQHRLANLSRKSKRKHISTGKKIVSWIWTAHLGPEDCRLALDESIRVNWSKAHHRVQKWTEEVYLLQEEMRRVLRSLDHMEKQWKGYADNLAPEGSALRHGQRAYALRQAKFYSRIRARFFEMWSTPFGRDRLTVTSVSELEIE